MDQKEMIQVLSSLAHGVDPISEKPWPKDAPYGHPKVIRALFMALDLLKGAHNNLENGLVADGSTKPLRSGRTWSTEQDEDLRNRYEGGAALPELMFHFNRGRGALIARLKLLGLIDDEDHVRD